MRNGFQTCSKLNLKQVNILIFIYFYFIMIKIFLTDFQIYLIFFVCRIFLNLEKMKQIGPFPP